MLYTFHFFFQYCLILLDVCKTLMIVFIQQYENMDNAHRYCKQTQLKSRSRDLLNHWKSNRSPVCNICNIRFEFYCSNDVIVGYISLPHYREIVKSLFVPCLFKILLSPGVLHIVHIKGIVIFLHMKTLLMIYFLKWW